MVTFEIRREGDSASRSFDLDAETVLIGRSRRADIPLVHTSVSKEHLSVDLRGPQIRFRDLGSTNGTFVNGIRAREGTLGNGDEIRLGEFTITVSLPGARGVVPPPPLPSPPGPPTPPSGDASEDAPGDASEDASERDGGPGPAPEPLASVGEPEAVPPAPAISPTGVLFPDAEETEDEETPPSAGLWLVDVPYWAVSAVLHLVVLILLAAIPFAERTTRPADDTPLAVRLPPAVRPYDPDRERANEWRPEIRAPEVLPQPVIRAKIDEPDIPKGTDFSKLANLDLRSDAISAAIGAAGAASGAYGHRYGKGSLIREGGSMATEEAVRAALEWLLRHQSDDGSWKARDFVENCTKRCAILRPTAHTGGGLGPPEYDVGVTGLAILAFAGYGHTHIHGVQPEYVEAVRAALDYLRSQQMASTDRAVDGRFGPLAGHWVYNHAIATMAMCELLAMSGDISLHRSTRRAVDLLLYLRNPGAAWRYGVRDGDNDVSVTGWMLLALKAARAARVPMSTDAYRQAFRDSVAFLERMTDAQGKTGYRRRGEFRTPLPCMTSVAVLARLFAGEPRSSSRVRQGVELCVRDLPRWDESQRRRINIYHWYYASYALFQYGGAAWNQWNPPLQKALLESQRRGGCEDGSWDPVGEWGPRGGRVYSTALGAMTFEVYYRFRRISDVLGPDSE